MCGKVMVVPEAGVKDWESPWKQIAGAQWSAPRTRHIPVLAPPEASRGSWIGKATSPWLRLTDSSSKGRRRGVGARMD